MSPAYNEKMIAAKLRLLERFRKEKKERTEAQGKNRLPPGQHEVANFPVLDLGVHPEFDPKTWRFEVFGEVERPMSWSWEEFLKLPKASQTSDFHCVTTWSRFDLPWAGVKMSALCELVKPKPTANFVIQHSNDGYTTNTSIHEATQPDAMLAYEVEGKPLTLEHGGPMRMLIPTLYAWKSAKFLKALEFSLRDKPGYWEVRGYHNNADPWKEERNGTPPADGFEGI